MIESAVQVSDSLRSSMEHHRPPTPILSTHSQEVQVNFLSVKEEEKMEEEKAEQPPQITLVDLSDKVTNLAE
jgi:hypothetical protein